MTGWLLLQAVYLGGAASELAAVVGKGGGAVVGRRSVGLAEGAVAAVAHGARAGDAAWALGGGGTFVLFAVKFISKVLT